jgi:ubiquinone biosynthesis protein UbiJ
MARATAGDVIVRLMTAVTELQRDMRSQSEQMARLSTDMKHSVQQFGRIAKLLGELAEATDERFDELEERVDRLEHASGK